MCYIFIFYINIFLLSNLNRYKIVIRGFVRVILAECITGNTCQIIIKPLYLCIKAAPWDNINFRFYFCNGVVYPPDHDFIFLRVFRFYQHFYESA